jgi:hypothetical protein
VRNPNCYKVPGGEAFMDRALDDTDRYLVSFCVAYTDYEGAGCESPRQAAQAAMELAKDGFPVFVYDRLHNAAHRFECWSDGDEKRIDERGFAEGWYLVYESDGGGEESFYRADGSLVPANEAFDQYESLARFTNERDADNHAEALGHCGKRAVPRHLTYFAPTAKDD